MSRKYKFHNQDKLYFISCPECFRDELPARLNHSGGDRCFCREEYTKMVLDSWKFCQENKDLEIYGWCIMPSHVHMIIGSNKNKLEDIVRDMKSFTSTALKKAIKENAQESRKECLPSQITPVRHESAWQSGGDSLDVRKGRQEKWQ